MDQFLLPISQQPISPPNFHPHCSQFITHNALSSASTIQGCWFGGSDGVGNLGVTLPAGCGAPLGHVVRCCFWIESTHVFKSILDSGITESGLWCSSKTPDGNCPNFLVQVCDWLIRGIRPSLLEFPKLILILKVGKFLETNVSVCWHPEHKQTRWL